eukprot:4466863-Ditylum_brightwellii.AAC.1
MACQVKKQDNDKDLFTSPDEIDLSNDDTTEIDDIDQPGPSKCSARICKPTPLFDPGIGPARNWSLDMVANETLILNNHACKLSDDGAENLFSLLTEIYDMEDKTHPNACYMSKRHQLMTKLSIGLKPQTKKSII